MSMSTLHLQEDARAALQTIHLIQRYTMGLSRSRSSSGEGEEEAGDVAYLNHWYQRWREVQQDRAVKALRELGMEVPARATVNTDQTH